MNSKLPFLIPVFALAAGWVCGWIFTPAESIKSHAAVANASAAPVGTTTDNQSHQPDTSDSLSRKVDTFLKKLPTFTGNFVTMQVKVYEFAKALRSDEFAAVIAQCSQQNMQASKWITHMLAEYWMEIDTPAALAWFERLSAEQQNDFSSAILGAWGRKQDGEMLTWAEKLPDNKLHMLLRNHYGLIGETVRPEDFDRLLALIRKSPSYGNELKYASGSATGYLFLTLAKAAPMDAISRAMTLPSGGGRNQALAGAVFGWASNDPTAARQWAESIEDPALAAYVITACANGMLEDDAKSAAEWIASLPDTLTNQDTLTGAVRMWAAEDPKAALEWVDDFPEGANTRKYISGILSAMAEQDPVLAIETVLSRAGEGQTLGMDKESNEYNWLNGDDTFANYLNVKGMEETLNTASGIPDKGDYTLDAVYKNLLTAAANENFAGTTEWLLKQQNGKRRGESFGALASQVFYRDPTAARTWAEALPKNADTDTARLNIADSSFQREADAAVKIYRQVTDRQRGEDGLKTQVRNWLKSDPVAAESWLSKTTAFNDIQKSELRQKGATR